jgi:hypothetical protein
MQACMQLAAQEHPCKHTLHSLLPHGLRQPTNSPILLNAAIALQEGVYPSSPTPGQLYTTLMMRAS